MKQVDVIIVGAGAAGLMCAAQAGYKGLSVLVVDHAPKAAGKIRISGGGRANFTNMGVNPSNFLCDNPHFVKSALAQYGSQDFIDLVDRHGLAYEQRALGKLFCEHRASDLIQILRTECDWAGCQFQLKTAIESVKFLVDKSQYQVNLQPSEGASEAVVCQNLVVATGALSFPKLKASGWGYQLAQQFGLAVLPVRPGLVPLVFTGKWHDFCASLSGLALDVAVSVERAEAPSFSEAILFTHHGLSGPAILQASNYWERGQYIEINLLPELNIEQALLDLKADNSLVVSWFKNHFPRKFYQAWLALFPMPERLADTSNDALKAYAQQLQHWRLYPSDTAGYDKAEVTLGGIDTDELQSKDCQVKKQSGLYFIGEVLDVTGQLGGYNFQWAWSSGYVAAQSLTPLKLE